MVYTQQLFLPSPVYIPTALQLIYNCFGQVLIVAKVLCTYTLLASFRDSNI